MYTLCFVGSDSLDIDQTLSTPLNGFMNQFLHILTPHLLRWRGFRGIDVDTSAATGSSDRKQSTGSRRVVTDRVIIGRAITDIAIGSAAVVNRANIANSTIGIMIARSTTATTIDEAIVVAVCTVVASTGVLAIAGKACIGTGAPSDRG